jgi:voltage-gated potassium channel
VERKPIPHDLTARRAGQIIASVTFVVALVGGVLMWLIDKEDFPTIGSGMWWSVQTITTVGYGDKVPTSTAGKALAAVVMVTALGFLSVVTAAISAMLSNRPGAGAAVTRTSRSPISPSGSTRSST